MIPPFDASSGYLPVGEHNAEWREFVERYSWNDRRRWLLSGLRRLASNLRDAGCRSILVDGSFVTSTPYPSDYDACCDYGGIDPLKVDLRLLGPRAVMKAYYFGEVRPERWLADAGITFREFYQSDRDGRPKGIVHLSLRDVP